MSMIHTSLEDVSTMKALANLVGNYNLPLEDAPPSKTSTLQLYPTCDACRELMKDLFTYGM